MSALPLPTQHKSLAFHHPARIPRPPRITNRVPHLFRQLQQVFEKASQLFVLDRAIVILLVRYTARIERWREKVRFRAETENY